MTTHAWRPSRFWMVPLLIVAGLTVSCDYEPGEPGNPILGPLVTGPQLTVVATNYTYTLDADFDLGTLVNVNHDAPSNDQLQLNTITTPFPFINVAASGRGTVVRIDVNTGAVLGEYLTAPDGRGRNPSRTTVDLNGSVWVANRDEDGGGKGSIARIGLVIGGTRTDAGGTPNLIGEYLAPPFQYNTCVDKDSDNLIKTSHGLGDIRPWTNAGGVDTDGGVATADDECIINYVRVTGTGTRTVAVDANNDVWVGGFTDFDHEAVDGPTAVPIVGTQFNLGCGGYGGLIDGNGILWSAGRGHGLLRYNTVSKSGACLGTGRGDYGLGIDPATGHIWHTYLLGNRVAELDGAGNVLNTYSHGSYNSQGVAVDGVGNVWVAHSLVGPSSTVGHLRTDGTYVGNVTVGSGPTGVAVDANGKIWVANYYSHTAMRIDPNLGPLGGGGYNVGAVDLTVDLNYSGGVLAYPYNYSDMTGFVAVGSTSPQGSWTVVQNGGAPGVKWGRITWNTEVEGSIPAGTSITVEARAADTEAGLGGQSFVTVTNGTFFDITGRYIEVRVTLAAAPDGTSPVLSDISIEPAVIDVGIDIKPFSWPNSINPKSGGVVPVAILGAADFDVTTVDVATLTFGPAEATPAHDLGDPDTYYDHTHEWACDAFGMCAWVDYDANGDGIMDLVSHYVQKEAGLQFGDSEACIDGETQDGIAIHGCDEVRVLGK